MVRETKPKRERIRTLVERKQRLLAAFLVLILAHKRYVRCCNINIIKQNFQTYQIFHSDTLKCILFVFPNVKDNSEAPLTDRI